MIREAIGQQLDHDPNFRWRGEQVTRIENLSDIAFALALGMIISGTDVPRTFEDLQSFLFYLVPTAAAFGIMLQIWNIHFTFFRRYGVADRTIILLNAILIFVVLYLAYPLRFTFDALYAWVIGQITHDYSRAFEIGMTGSNGAMTISFFVIGFGVCTALLALKHEHIILRRSQLSLNDYEFAATRATRAQLWFGTLVAFSVAPVALLTQIGPMAAFLLFLQIPATRLTRWYYHRTVSS